MKNVLRPVAFTLLGLIGLSAVWLTGIQATAGSDYRDDPRNVRAAQAPADSSRGRILTADGVVVAEDGPDGERIYPEGARYAHIVGYDAAAGRTGIELTRYAAMRSRDDGSITAWLLSSMGADLGPPDVHLTIVDAVQKAAVAGLGSQTGAVVAIDPRTGAVLAYVSTPGFDPNDVVGGSFDPTDDASQNALIDRVADRLLPPGSTFKVIVSAAALVAGITPDTAFDDATEYVPPDGIAIHNAGDDDCITGSTLTLTDALVVSCNVVFARLAVDTGARAIVSAAEQAWFNHPLPWETGAAKSSIPTAASFEADPAALAQSGLGERDVRATPLLMALIASALGDDGVAMKPFVVDSVVAPDGEAIEVTSPETLTRMFPSAVVEDLLAMMTQVVERGTGRSGAVQGITVAGKTGTAEGAGGPHAWFIAVAPVENPTIAVAVLVEGGGAGGSVAAPIAARVMEAWLNFES
ncbi:MAG TPA: penicillin-binding transpeptidase domain-containing protein [Acidimicrobiia bacterium]|nr:penicillin-binding transpeptidase domain-containing protein [Acidimicrobiia bacterium]